MDESVIFSLNNIIPRSWIQWLSLSNRKSQISFKVDGL